MSSARFLLTRRWIIFAIVVGLLAWAAWLLGQWQFHRLEDRKDRNAVVERNEGRPPAPVADVLAVGDKVARTEEWKRVTATGEYAVEDTVVIRYRTRDSAGGIDAVVPLVTEDGTALLVDRGFLATDNRPIDVADIPPPPTGQVTITGWVRADATGDSTRVTDKSARSISSKEIGPALGREVYGGFVDLEEEDPPPADQLEGAELPETNNGPHFFYGLQWWFFGVLAIFGFCYLAYDEWRKSQAPQHASVDGHHGPGDET